MTNKHRQYNPEFLRKIRANKDKIKAFIIENSMNYHRSPVWADVALDYICYDHPAKVTSAKYKVTLKHVSQATELVFIILDRNKEKLDFLYE